MEIWSNIREKKVLNESKKKETYLFYHLGLLTFFASPNCHETRNPSQQKNIDFIFLTANFDEYPEHLFMLRINNAP